MDWLVEECLDAVQARGTGALDEMCAAHPEYATGLRSAVRRASALPEDPPAATSGLERGSPAGLSPVNSVDSPTQATEQAGAASEPQAEPAPGGSFSPGPEPGFPMLLGNLQLIQWLGAGSTGVIYRANEAYGERPIAVKLIQPDMLTEPEALDRFQRDLGIIRDLDHPGILSIRSVGEIEEVPYHTRDLLRGAKLDAVLHSLRGRAPESLAGDSLAAALAESAIDRTITADSVVGSIFDCLWVETSMRIVRQVAEALEHAHTHGVWHLNLDPSNIVISPAGRALLLDFGMPAAATRTVYAAPELLDDQPGDARSDIWSLGVVLYELLTLQHPFAVASSEGEPELGEPSEIEQRIRRGEIQDLHRLNALIPKDAATVVARALASDPAERYASADEMARDLETVIDGRWLADPAATTLPIVGLADVGLAETDPAVPALALSLPERAAASPEPLKTESTELDEALHELTPEARSGGSADKTDPDDHPMASRRRPAATERKPVELPTGKSAGLLPEAKEPASPVPVSRPVDRPVDRPPHATRSPAPATSVAPEASSRPSVQLPKLPEPVDEAGYEFASSDPSSGFLGWLSDHPILTAAGLFGAVYLGSTFLEKPADSGVLAAQNASEERTEEASSASADSQQDRTASLDPRVAASAGTEPALGFGPVDPAEIFADPADDRLAVLPDREQVDPELSEHTSAGESKTPPSQLEPNGAGPVPAAFGSSKQDSGQESVLVADAAAVTPDATDALSAPLDSENEEGPADDSESGSANAPALHFLAELFEARADGAELLAREVLERGSDRLDSTALNPLMRIDLGDFLGRSYRALLDPAAAEPLLVRTIEAARAEFGSSDEHLVPYTVELADLWMAEERWDEAESLLVQVLSDRGEELGLQDGLLVVALEEIAEHHKQAGDLQRADQLLTPALDGARRALGDEALDTLHIINNLAIVKDELGLVDQAEPLYREALDLIRSSYGERHEYFVYAAGNLATLCESQGRPDEAEELYSSALERSLEVFGEDHSATFLCRDNLAGFLNAQDRHDEAAGVYKQMLAGWNGLIGDGDEATMITLFNLGNSYLQERRYDEAIPLLTDSFQNMQYRMGDDDPDTIAALLALIDAYRGQQSYSSAESFARLLVGRTPEDSPEYQERMQLLDSLSEQVAAER